MTGLSNTMRRALGVGLALAAGAGRLAAGAVAELNLADTDRLLVLAPHPDDETIGCGGVLQAAAERGIPARVVYFTLGDNNQWSFVLYRKRPVLKPESVQAMGEVRHGEALRAAARLGLAADALTFLGYPDFGTLRIWNAHWGDTPPLRSMLTRTNAVPYANAFRPGAPYTGEAILRDLAAVLEDARPTKVFLPHPADHNPDHRALYLFARVALSQLEHRLRPQLHPYLVHFPKWPAPRRLAADRPLEPPAPLRDSVAWTRWPLTPEQAAAKREALQAHASQFRYSGAYLSSFVRANELFGDYPPLNLRAADARAPGATNLSEAADEMAEELTVEERDAFTGVEWNFMRREGNDLVLAVDLTRPLFKTVQLEINLCGFRRDRPFAELPKLRVVVGELVCRVFDRARRVETHPVTLARRPRSIELRLPLDFLGNPDRLLLSARTTLTEVPFDWTAWRVVRLDGAAAPAAP